MTGKDESRTGAARGEAGDAAHDRPESATAEPQHQVSEIREGIEQTRADMTETIHELQERLSPAHLKEQIREQVSEQYRQVKETVRDATIGKVQDMVGRVGDTMYDTRRSIVDTIAANPVPAALVGIGLAWLWMNRRSDSATGLRGRERAPGRRYDDFGRRIGGASASTDFGRDSRREWEIPDTAASRTGGAVSAFADQLQGTAASLADKAKATAGSAADKARATVTGAVSQAQDSAQQLVYQAQYQAQRVEERLAAALQDNPLAIGAVALAVGTAVGLAIPQTRQENEWMGEARDSLVDKAQSVAHEAMDRVQEVAQRVSDEVAPDRPEQGAL